jgi:hypothetical protein
MDLQLLTRENVEPVQHVLNDFLIKNFIQFLFLFIHSISNYIS